MVKVLFVNPPYSPFTPPESVVPPLGLARVITASKQTADIRLVDMGCEEVFGNDSWTLLDYELRKFKPDIIGIGPLTSANIYKGEEIAKYAKSLQQSIITIFGGADPSAAFEKRLNECKELDAVAVGESEFLFAKFLDVWDKTKYWPKINGLAFRNNGKIIFSNVSRLSLDDFSRLPPPDWSFFHLDKYRKIANRFGFKPYLSLEMSRGCPYNCIFCVSKNVFGHHIKMRSQKNIIKELEDAINRFGYTRFSFNDDNAGMNAEYLLSLSKKILQNISTKIEFTLTMRPDSPLFDNKSILINLVKAGLKEIFLGCESEDSKVIRKTIKTKNPDKWKEQIRYAIELCRKSKIATRTNWMIALPEQTMESFLNTINFICEIKPNTSLISILQPYPGTDITNNIHGSWNSYGIKILSSNPSDYSASKYDPPIETKWLSRDEIIGLIYLFLRRVGSTSIADVSGSPYYLFEYWKNRGKVKLK